MLQDEQGQLDVADREIIEQIKNSDLIADKIEKDFQPLTFGEKMSDKLAEFGGSWGFLISFSGFLLFWIVLNSVFLYQNPLDPYPFILLNLMLSCLAAVQAPIIMMSQRRQEARDRFRAQSDFKVNLKAELEIALLSEKVDHLMMNQHRKLMELMLIQSDMLREIVEKQNRKSS
jgi:uncharacterized membrane protein